MSRLQKVLRWRAGAILAGSTLLVSAAGLTALAPAAQAGTVTPTVHCVLPVGQGEATGPQDHTVTITPSNTSPGSSVHVKVALGVSPAKSTATLNNVTATPHLTLAMSGAATGTRVVDGASWQLSTVNGQSVQTPPFEGDIAIPTGVSGVINFTPVRNTTDVQYLGTQITNCDVVGTTGVVASVNVQGPGSAQPSLTAPTTAVLSGGPVALSGAGFAPNTTIVPSLCDTAGNNCISSNFASNNLTVNASGVLSGTANLAGGVANGNYRVQVATGGSIGSAPLSVTTYVPTQPHSLTLSSNRGPVGTTVTVKGANYTPNTFVYLGEYDAAKAEITGFLGYAQTIYDGTFSVGYEITDPGTKFIGVSVDAVQSDVYAAFTVGANPPTLNVTNPGETHRGGKVTLTGANWGGTTTATLCNATGTGCAASGISASTLAVSATGNLTGNVTISNSATYGNHTIKVTDAGGNSAVTPVFNVNQRWIEISSNPIKSGTILTVKTHGFTPLLWVSYAGFDAAGNRTADATLSGSWSDSSGNASGLLLIKAANTKFIKAWVTIDSGKTAWLPVTVN